MQIVQIQDVRKTISVGEVIRKITSYMFNEYTRVIKELSTQVNIENKRQALSMLMKDLHKCCKKLHAFAKNCHKFEKIRKIDQLSAIMFDYSRLIGLVIDQLFVVHEMCRFYRTPQFNLEQSTKVINFDAHSSFKKQIAQASAKIPSFAAESKKKKFEFIEKFYYNENDPTKSNGLNEKSDSKAAMEKMKKDCLCNLNISTQLIRLQNLELGELTLVQDSILLFKYNDLAGFKIMLYTYTEQSDQQEDPRIRNYLTYFCTGIHFAKFQKFYSMEEKYMQKYKAKLTSMLNAALFAEIKISLDQEKLPDLLLPMVKSVIKKVILGQLYSDIFTQMKKNIKDYLMKFEMPLTVDTNQKDEIVIQLKHEIHTEDFSIRMCLKPSDFPDFFSLISSHYIMSEDPLIYLNDHTTLHYFPNISKLNLHQILVKKIQEFQNIHMWLICEKLKKLLSIFIPFQFQIINDDELYKIHLVLDKKFNLLTLFSDNTGALRICDEDFIFDERKNGKQSEQLLLMIKGFLQTEAIDIIKFNEIVFVSFIKIYFRSCQSNVEYENLLGLNQIKIKFFILHNCQFHKTLVMEIVLHLCEGNHFFIIGISLNLIDGNNSFTSMEFDDMTSKSQLNLTKEELLPMNIASFGKIQIGVSKFISENEEFLNNYIESQSLVGSVQASQNFDTLVVTIENNYKEFSTCIDGEIFEFFTLVIKELHIVNKNVIIRIYFNEEYLKSFFPGVLKSYNIFEGDNIIFFNHKDSSLTFYFLTKLTLKNNEFNYIKRFVYKILNKFLYFLRKITLFLSKQETKEVLAKSENVVMSPIGIQFKYTFFEKITKTICFQFHSSPGPDRKNLRALILPYEYHYLSLYSFDLHFKHINDSDENQIFQAIKNFIFISLVYNMLSTRFSSFIFPIGRRTFEYVSGINPIFVFMKDMHTFHIICHNKLSIYLEIPNCNKIEIYSTYLWNQDNCFRFLETLAEPNENSLKDCSSNSYKNNTDRPQKVIILNNSPAIMLQDLAKLIDHIEHFSKDN